MIDPVSRAKRHIDETTGVVPQRVQERERSRAARYRPDDRDVEVPADLTVGGIAHIIPKVNPVNCRVGDLNVTTAGQLYVCSAINVWTLVGSQV